MNGENMNKLNIPENWHEVPNSNSPTVISTFCGCGGSSLGYRFAGFRELLAIDFEKHACECFRLNFPEVPCWEKDIKNITAEEILNFCNIKKGELDIFDGSPPCQGFSTAGKREINDPRNDLFKEYVRLIRGLEPKIFVMENVSGMVKGSMKGRFKEIILTLKSLNYNVECKKLNAMWYGVPQSRERMFFIGIRKDLNKNPVWPEHTVNKPITVDEALKNVIFEDVPPLTKSIKELVPKLKNGQCLADIGGKGFQTVRVYGNKPCPTLIKLKAGIGFGMLIHPKENRVFSIPEMKRLATFPDNFKFSGSYIDIKSRIGNAVMPLQMKAIAETLKKEILNK